VGRRDGDRIVSALVAAARIIDPMREVCLVIHQARIARYNMIVTACTTISMSIVLRVCRCCG
jgi:hypothetical protein